MPAIINSDDGVVSGSSGLKTSGANDGILALQNNGTTNATVTAAGNVGIGTSSPSYKLDVSGEIRTTSHVRGTGSDVLYVIGGASNNNNNIYVGGSSAGTANTIAFTTAGSERARIDSSGNLLVGITSTGSTPTYGAAYIAGDRSVGSSNYYAQVFVPHNSATNHGIVVKELAASGIAIGFLNSSNSVVGSITTTNTATAYNTSSDYRLKEQVQPITGALARVTALKPVTYKWKADGSDGEGFIAHELAEVCPQAVTGEKDAVDADGNPKYQGIDTSFLVATLTAAIQELKAELDATKAEVAALKAAAQTPDELKALMP